MAASFYYTCALLNLPINNVFVVSALSEIRSRERVC